MKATSILLPLSMQYNETNVHTLFDGILFSRLNIEFISAFDKPSSAIFCNWWRSQEHGYYGLHGKTSRQS